MTDKPPTFNNDYLYLNKGKSKIKWKQKINLFNLTRAELEHYYITGETPKETDTIKFPKNETSRE